MLNQNKDWHYLILTETCWCWNVLRVYNGTWQEQWHVRAEMFCMLTTGHGRGSGMSELKCSACLQRDMAGAVACPSWNVLHAYNGTWQVQWHVRAETFYRFRVELDRNSDLSVQALQRNTIGAVTYIHSCNWTGHERTWRYRSSTGHERHIHLPEFNLPTSLPCTEHDRSKDLSDVNTFYKLTMYRTR